MDHFYSALVFLVALLVQGLTAERISVKLIDGSSKWEGSIYVKRGSDWGLVCDDDWSIEAGDVVCRQLGFGNAKEISLFNLFRSDFSEKIFLDDVKCLGHESNLGECKHREWLENNCHAGEAAGVVCEGNPEQPEVEPDSDIVVPVSDVNQLVEREDVFLLQDHAEPVFQELRAAPDGFMTVESHAIPAHSSVELPVSTPEESVETEPSSRNELPTAAPDYSKRTRHILDRVRDLLNNDTVQQRSVDRVSDDRPQLSELSQRFEEFRSGFNLDSSRELPELTTEKPVIPTQPRVPQPIPVEEVRKVENLIEMMKSDQPRRFARPLRISVENGRVNSEGYVKVYMDDGTSGVICSDNWGIYEAQVVCKQTMNKMAEQSTVLDYYRGAREDKVIYEVNCDGHERSLFDCEYKLSDSHGIKCSKPGNVAGVVCTSAKMPDLMPDIYALTSSLHIQSQPLSTLTCAMEENCLSSSAQTAQMNSYSSMGSLGSYNPYGGAFSYNVGPQRKLMRFSSSIFNNGTADFRPHQHRTSWEWHSCHQHYHSMNAFSHYDILDSHGNRVAEGHKASFCLEDVECKWPHTKTFSCRGYADQGISVGCADVYKHDIDCQWIDITDLEAGAYVFKLEVNPNQQVPELSFDNNAAICEMSYNGFSVKLSNCVLSRG